MAHADDDGLYNQLSRGKLLVELRYGLCVQHQVQRHRRSRMQVSLSTHASHARGVGPELRGRSRLRVGATTSADAPDENSGLPLPLRALPGLPTPRAWP